MTLREATEALRDSEIENAAFEARTLFSHFECLPEYKLIGNNPTSHNPLFEDAIKRRAKREPLQYIIGEVGFYREVYKVTPDCLIPREDTELLVDTAVKLLPDGAKFLDLCTGSGCVVVSTLKNTNNTTAKAVDISPAAIKLAEENAVLNGVADRLELSVSDVLSSFSSDEKFDAILSNPPYVTNDAYKALEAEIFQEPRIAFVGGVDGGDFYRSITNNYKSSLSAGGFIAYEIGYDQSELILQIAEENGMRAEILYDLSGRARVAILRFPNKLAVN